MSERLLPTKFLSAVLALPALPGSSTYCDDPDKVVEQALNDAEKYIKAGVDSIFLENCHDVPFIKPPLSEELVSLTITIAKEIRKKFHGPIGVQLLEAANEESLRVASEADLDYIRVEGYVFAHVGGAGIIEGCAGKLLHLRKQLGCQHIKVYADVKKKHCAHALTGDLDITDEVRQAEFFRTDGIVVTSQFSGIEPNADDLRKVREATKLPILVGSGMAPENIEKYIDLADGFIVGSSLRKNGAFLGEVDEERLRTFVDAIRTARGSQ